MARKRKRATIKCILTNSWNHCNVSAGKKQSPLFTAAQNEIKALQLWVAEPDVWDTWQVFTSYLIIPECWPFSFHCGTITFLHWTERRWLNFASFLLSHQKNIRCKVKYTSFGGFQKILRKRLWFLALMLAVRQLFPFLLWNKSSLLLNKLESG